MNWDPLKYTIRERPFYTGTSFVSDGSLTSTDQSLSLSRTLALFLLFRFDLITREHLFLDDIEPKEPFGAISLLQIRLWTSQVSK